MLLWLLIVIIVIILTIRRVSRSYWGTTDKAVTTDTTKADTTADTTAAIEKANNPATDIVA
jgi:hypothetical protein